MQRLRLNYSVASFALVWASATVLAVATSGQLGLDAWGDVARPVAAAPGERGADDASAIEPSNGVGDKNKRWSLIAEPTQRRAAPIIPDPGALWANIPQWFLSAELLPGCSLSSFDASQCDSGALTEAGRSMLALEAEYASWLRAQDDSIAHRLVSRERAALAIGDGLVVIGYPSNGMIRYLVCTAAESAPLLLLREKFSELAWTEAWVSEETTKLAAAAGFQSVWFSPTDDGSTYDITSDGVVIGSGRHHVPGTLWRQMN